MVAEQIRVLQTKSLLGMKRLVVCSFDWRGCNGYTEGYIAMYQKDRERVAAKAGRGGGAAGRLAGTLVKKRQGGSRVKHGATISNFGHC